MLNEKYKNHKRNKLKPYFSDKLTNFIVLHSQKKRIALLLKIKEKHFHSTLKNLKIKLMNLFRNGLNINLIYI